MNNKKHLALMLAAMVLGFGTMSGSTPSRVDLASAKVVKAASKAGGRLPTVVLRDGPGPVCWPGLGCGYR
jgi:hypothetical protein